MGRTTSTAPARHDRQVARVYLAPGQSVCRRNRPARHCDWMGKALAAAGCGRSGDPCRIAHVLSVSGARRSGSRSDRAVTAERPRTRRAGGPDEHPALDDMLHIDIEHLNHINGRVTGSPAPSRAESGGGWEFRGRRRPREDWLTAMHRGSAVAFLHAPAGRVARPARGTVL